MKTIQFTRADYMAGTCTHRQYYAQFVTPHMLAQVVASIGAERLAKSKDPHLNDIPLATWDQLAGGMRTQLGREQLKLAGDFPSLAGAVCILKEAARQTLETTTQTASPLQPERD